MLESTAFSIGRRSARSAEGLNSPVQKRQWDYSAELTKIAPDEKLPTYMTEDGVLMRRIISAEADVLVSETHSEALNS